MAIEIIPKRRTERASLINVSSYILIIVFLLFLASYFVLDFYQKKSAQEILALDKSIERSPSEKNIEDGIISYQKEIEDADFLLSNHRLVANLFDNLEKNTHPKVQFSKFTLNSETDIIDVSGVTDSFETLGQQTLIFEKQEFIKNINLSKVSMAKDGKINFELRLAFDSKIFTPPATQ